MAAVAGLSKATISRIWRTFGLQSHRVDTFKLSADPQFVEKVRDIVGLYLSPPDHALVLCVDEKSQVQALERSRLLLPMRPGIPPGKRTITSGMGPPCCLPHWMSRRETSSGSAIGATASKSC
jgi:hypothetical protein